MAEIINYVPGHFDHNIVPLDVPSAWVGLEKLIRPILDDFDIKPLPTGGWTGGEN